MNWDKLEGNWKEFSGKAKQKWGKLTDDDLTQARGRRQELAGAVQKRYGIEREKAEEQVKEFARSCGC